MEEALGVKYVQINSVPHGSTGEIMMRKHRDLLSEGVDSYVFWGRGRAGKGDWECKFGTDPGIFLDVLQTRIDGKAGFHSRSATKRLLAKLDEIDPDVVHLHNIHGYYVNIELLFNWLAERKQKTYWTLHDCWAFTGHCAYFTYAKCDQWKDHCACDRRCPQLSTYPKTFSMHSCAWNFERKRRLFTALEDLTVITPSQWLADLIAQSFLSTHRIEVRNNVVDADVFKPTPGNIRARYNLGGKFVILGIASPWTERKGLKDFIRLADMVGDSCSIVLVGLKKNQMKDLPKQVIPLSRTASKEELAAIYTAADVLFNPTREDNYPMVNLESEACGTPVVSYDIGGCGETLHLSRSCVVPAGDLEAAYEAIARLAYSDDGASSGTTGQVGSHGTD